MFRLDDALRVYLHRDPIDFRPCINTLCTLIEQPMQLDAFARAVFVFVSAGVILTHRVIFTSGLTLNDIERMYITAADPSNIGQYSVTSDFAGGKMFTGISHCHGHLLAGAVARRGPGR